MKTLPTSPGEWYWTEWACHVQVYRKGKGSQLYTRVPGGLEVRITPRIAGSFHPTKVGQR